MWRGRLITVDDSMITLMDVDGRVRFIPSAAVRSRTLCPEAEQVPSSAVYVQMVRRGHRAGVDGPEAGTHRTGPEVSGAPRADRVILPPNPAHDAFGWRTMMGYHRLETGRRRFGRLPP